MCVFCCGFQVIFCIKHFDHDDDDDDDDDANEVSIINTL